MNEEFILNSSEPGIYCKAEEPGVRTGLMRLLVWRGGVKSKTTATAGCQRHIYRGGKH